MVQFLFSYVCSSGFTGDREESKKLMKLATSEVLVKTWRYDVTWHQLTSFGHLSDYHLSNPELHKSAFRYLHDFFMICRKFNVLAFILWVKHQNWTIFDEVIGFCFLLRNFPDFDWILRILAQNLLTSSLSLNFLHVFLKYLWKWTFLPKIMKIAFFPQEIWG